MRNCFVFTLSDKDSYRIANSATVNINDSSFFCYTFWKPRIGGKKQTYITPYRFSNEALDLLYISLMIFYVDRKVKRKDQNDAWTRYFELYMPVKDEVKWEGCKKILTDALNFLTGDHWILHFRSWTSLTDEEYNYRKGRHRYRRSIKTIDTDVFCMLSGGLDSFIGAINLLKDGKKPFFISHYGGGKGVKKYQDNVVNSLSTYFNVRQKCFFRFYAAAQGGEEDTTRSRSLMFFAHAIAIASGMNHHVDLYIPENGVISLNIPLTIMRLGSLSTRTTHPYFMDLLQQLITKLGLDITLINPFQFLTKGEMMATCLDQDFLNGHYHNTLSCSHPDQGRWSGEEAGHCGECLPCTIRRAAINAVHLEDKSCYRHNYDTPTGKEVLQSYKLGLSNPKDSMAAIQMSGPIKNNQQDYAALYERGIKELKDFIDLF